VLLLCGPTASGKTAVLEGLFAGGRALCPAEVVSADSMQVYRGMDIGTAKPGAELLAALPHHLIDIRSPGEQFNAGDFVRLAGNAVADIAARGKLPVISGGTGFYLNCFVRGLPPAPPSDPEIRRVLKEELRERGRDALYEELAGTDPVSAGRIHRNDEYRLLRALEVRRLSGRPLSDFKAPGPGEAREPGFARQDYRFLMIGLSRPREEVYRRIDERCAAMFRAGLPAEVRGLFEAGFGPEAPGMKAIGYREFFAVSGDGAPRFIEDTALVEVLVARNSRRYAKRQLTYFASLPDLIRADAGPDAAGELRPLIRAFLSGPAGGSSKSD
jgi:tRNA dimethylallyltransferase